MALLLVLGSHTLLLVSVIDLANLRVGLTNPFAKGFLPNILSKSVFGLYINKLWEFLAIIAFLFRAWTFTESSCSASAALFSMQDFFLGLLLIFNLRADYWRSFDGSGIGFSVKSSLPHFFLLTISLLAISTWWLFKAHTLRCLIVSVYLINILLQVLYISNLKRFLVEIYILTLLPNIWMCLKFCLISVKASSGITIALSATCLVSNRFRK